MADSPIFLPKFQANCKTTTESHCIPATIQSWFKSRLENGQELGNMSVWQYLYNISAVTLLGEHGVSPSF